MYKYIVSCYYWPTGDGRLRLRSFRIKSNRRAEQSQLADSQVVRLTSVDYQKSNTERRSAPRLRAICDVELRASLSLLDTETHESPDSLLFFGRTRDLSARGLSLVLPSTPIDERFCGSDTRLRISLYLPTGSVEMLVNPVRCVPLSEQDSAMGYLMGAEIVKSTDESEQLDSYLRSIDVTR